MADDITIRTVGPGDEAEWRRLWNLYQTFYQVTLSDAVTASAWRRIVSADTPHIGGLVAERGPGLVGMLNFVVHEITWAIAPVCYLEDLYVDEAVRGGGIGRALIERLVARGRDAGWHRIYWNTARDNSPAQRLYNKLAERTGWVRYDIDLV